MRKYQSGFTLIEIAIVLLVVSILLGYTVALFPIQQELKQYRAVEKEMDEIITAIIGFAQVNGRLPCPSIPASGGSESGGGTADCDYFGGFVPVNTLGFSGRLNADLLLLDPWGSPYRYYVTPGDVGGLVGGDFVMNGDMRAIGLVDEYDVENGAAGSDGYIDLDGRYMICDAAGTTTNEQCTGAAEIFGKDAGFVAALGPFAGAPFVIVSLGKDWASTPTGDQLENRGASQTGTAGMPPNGPSGTQYWLKDVAGDETTFVKRPTGLADDFDDVIKWASPNALFSKMIEAGQLP